MIQQPEFYQFGYYAPNTRKEPEPEILASLLEIYKDKALLPTTIQEMRVSPKAPHGIPRLEPRLQLQLTSANQQWNLAFEQTRILLKKSNVVDVPMGRLDEFCRDAKEIFERLFNRFPFVGTRLSFAFRGLLAEMSEDELNESHKRIFSPLPFYVHAPPHEWNMRNASRIQSAHKQGSESLNVISDINRVQGTIEGDLGPIPFDRVQVGFDINTYQGNSDPRFHIEDLDWFLDESLGTSSKILNEIHGKLYE